MLGVTLFLPIFTKIEDMEIGFSSISSLCTPVQNDTSGEIINAVVPYFVLLQNAWSLV